jgi:glycine oxidase
VTATYDVIVVGGGPVGAACARELSLAGRRVLLLDPEGDNGQAWRAAAGMLAPQLEAEQDDPLLELGLAARDHCDSLATALRESIGADIGLWREGIAHLAGDEKEAGELWSKVAWQRQQGHLADWLDADEVKTRWPWVGPTAGALWAPHEGALEPERLVAALRADARRLGAVVEQDAASAIDSRKGRVTAVTGRHGRYAAGDVIVAAGAWSAGIAGIPRPIAVAPVRGQMAAFRWPTGARRAIVYGRGGYLVARGQEAIAGSTMEYAGFDPQVTPEGLADVFASAAALCPSLKGAEARRTWAGLRPMTPDGLPIIGAEPRLQGLWYATGHGRNGILLAGLTGLLMRQLLEGEMPDEDLAPYAPGRFWKW